MTKAKPYYCDWPVAEAGTWVCGRTDGELFDDDNGAYSHSRCTEHREVARKMTQLAKEKRNKERSLTCDPRSVELMRKMWVYGQKTAGERYEDWRQNR